MRNFKDINDKVGFYSSVISSEGNTPIHRAVLYGSIREVENWLSFSDANAMNALCETPLHLAVKIGDLAKIKLLLWRRDVDVNAQNIYGDTPLHYAVKLENWVSVVEVLNKCGADETITNNKGFTAVAIVCKKMRSECGELLRILDEKEHEINEELLFGGEVSYEEVTGRPTRRNSWSESVSETSTIDSAEKSVRF